MFNVSIAGRLIDDSQYKKLGAYDAAQFAIKVKHPKDEESIINCTLWGRRFESILDTYKKGCFVCVSGNAKYTEYTNEDGETKKYLQVSVNEFTYPEKRTEQTPQAKLETPDLPF